MMPLKFPFCLLSAVLPFLSSAEAKHASPVPKSISVQCAGAHVRDDKGNTPLHYSDNSPETVRRLLESGADVNARNLDGNTPLMMQKGISVGGEDCCYGVPVVRFCCSNSGQILMPATMRE